MPKRNAAVFKYRGHRLLWRRDIGTWEVHWTGTEGDDGTGRKVTRRHTLATANRDQAEQQLVAFADARAVLRLEPVEQVTIKMLATRYYENHAINLASAEAAFYRARHIIAGLGNLTVADLTIPAQERFVAALRAKPLASGTIARILTDLRAGIMRAWKRQEIDRPVHVIAVRGGPGRDRVLEIEELARLWAAAATEPHYVSMYLLLALGTGARHGALLELRREQVNLERGYIDLNPPGRERTAKGRPVVPLAPVLRPWIATVTAGHLVQLDGRPLGSIKSAFRRLRSEGRARTRSCAACAAPHSGNPFAPGRCARRPDRGLPGPLHRETNDRALSAPSSRASELLRAMPFRALISETARVGARAVSVSLAG